MLSVEDAQGLEERPAPLYLLLHIFKDVVKRLAGSKEGKSPTSASGVVDMSGIKLPWIEMSTFDCNILNCGSFGNTLIVPYIVNPISLTVIN